MLRRATKQANRFSWFATESGRAFSMGCAITFGVGSFAVNLLPHSLLLDKYRELFQMYRKSTPVRVSAKIKKQFEDVMNDLKVPEQTRALFKVFTVHGFDVFRAGTTYLLSGAVVGVPINFNDEKVKDIEQSKLLIKNKSIDWSQPDGQNLLSALMLSENAKKFVLGREIIRCQTAEPFFNSFFPFSLTIIAYGMGRRFNTMLNGFSQPLSARIILYTLTSLFALGNWVLCKDVTTTYYETLCDKEMAKLGKDYIEGGQEFYSKILQRNIALRNLMGDKGAKLYSASGNEEFFIRHKRVPIIHRKLYFDELLENGVSNDEQKLAS